MVWPEQLRVTSKAVTEVNWLAFKSLTIYDLRTTMHTLFLKWQDYKINCPITVYIIVKVRDVIFSCRAFVEGYTKNVYLVGKLI